MVGIAQYGDVKSLGTTTFAIFDVATAQTLFEREGQFDAISVAGKDGVTPQQLIDEIQPLLSGDAQVRSRSRRRRKQGRDQRVHEVHPLLPARLRRDRIVRRLVRDLQHALVTVAQRTREFATLGRSAPRVGRCCGRCSSRRS